MSGLEEIFKQWGYGTPLLYAAAAYGFFAWLDANASDEATDALSAAMKFMSVGNDNIAAALVELFDRIYTRPLLSWRAFRRSLLYTTMMSGLVAFELRELPNYTPGFYTNSRVFTGVLITLAFSYVVNAGTDYLSLFYIRRWLARAGARPVSALAVGTLLGIFVVSVGNLVRYAVMFCTALALRGMPDLDDLVRNIPESLLLASLLSIPAMVVFAWLPLLALGIFVGRLLQPLSWLVTKTQWALKDGNKHPLKAVGYIAAVAVLGIALVMGLVSRL